MANNLATEVYPGNDDVIRATATLTRTNTTTGAEEIVPLTGLAVQYYIASTAEAESPASAVNAGLVVTLAEAGATGIYYGSLTGAAKRTYLGASAEGTQFSHHIQSGTVYHETKSFIWRLKRTGA